MSIRQRLALSVGRATARLPLSIERVLWRTLRLGKAQPITRLSGVTRAGCPGSMIVAGLGPVEDYLPKLFFVGETERVTLVPSSVIGLPSRLRALGIQADITVARVDCVVARMFFSADYLALPEWVRSTAPVPETLAALSNRSNSLRQDLRLVRKYGYTALESKAESDLPEFYDTMFRPHTLARHESAEYLKSLRELTAVWKKGLLLWIILEGRRVGGILVSQNDKTLKLEALGTLTGDAALLRKGVLAAAYFHAFEYAKRVGCTGVDFGSTRPSLNDSLLRYKRKWGATVDAHSSNYFRLLTYWPTASPSVLALLNDFPLLFNKQGKLNVVHGNPEAPLSSSVIPGVSAIYVACPGTLNTKLRLDTPRAKAPGLERGEAASSLLGARSAASIVTL